MAFETHQLDEIRSRIKVSDVVGAKFKLRKQGSEFVAIEDQSLTVNDQKGLWYDFGKGDEGGDVFEFLQKHEGYTFVGAVEELAKRAGIVLQQRAGRNGSQASNGVDLGGTSTAERDRPAEASNSPARHAGGQTGKREVVATWDYVDPENVLLYQTVRIQERMPDGSWRLDKSGKIFKTFMQRRPAPMPGEWIAALDVIDRETNQPLEFLKTDKGTAWLRASKERLQWRNITTAQFGELGNVEHWLYNANAAIDELQEPKDDQRTIFLPEGEGKVDVLKEWGLLGVTNSGGAKNFTPACAEFFRGARHVVLLQDNDRAGAERVAKIAPMLKAVDVDLVQSLNFHDVWTGCPPKGDIKDWRDKGGGTKDALLEIVDDLKPWTPEPYKSKFGAKTAYDLGAPVRAYPWRIKGILPMHDNALLMGPSRSGKTFEALDMCMHILSGRPFAGRKTIPCGIVYLAYEGATGFENRLRAYLKHHNIDPADLHSFAWLTRPPNMFATEENAISLSDEILKVSESFRLPLGLIPLDTHNAATRGSSEIKSEDINKIIANYDTVKLRTGATLMVIGHTNAAGVHRGNEQFFNGIETAVLIERVYTDAKHTIEKRDDDGRVVRRGKIMKQREGDDRTAWEFVLESVKIGVDEDGDDITSMVSVEPTQHVPEEVITGKRDRPEGYYLNDTEVSQFKSMLEAIEKVGIPPPPELGLPSSVLRVIRSTDLGDFYRLVESKGDGETRPKYLGRIKTSLLRFKKRLSVVNVITVREAPDPKGGESHFMWPTGRRVYGRGLQWPPLPKKKKEQGMILAPGESSDLPPDIF